MLEQHFGRERFWKDLQPTFLRSIQVSFRISAEQYHPAFRKQRTELHGRGDSINARHLDVGDDECGIRGLRDEDRGFAGVGGRSLISSLRKDDCERVCDGALIIDDEDTITSRFIN